MAWIKNRSQVLGVPSAVSVQPQQLICFAKVLWYPPNPVSRRRGCLNGNTVQPHAFPSPRLVGSGEKRDCAFCPVSEAGNTAPRVPSLTCRGRTRNTFKCAFTFRVLKAVTSVFTNARRTCTCRTPESHVFGTRGVPETRMATGLGHRGALVDTPRLCEMRVSGILGNYPPTLWRSRILIFIYCVCSTEDKHIKCLVINEWQ